MNEDRDDPLAPARELLQVLVVVWLGLIGIAALPSHVRVLGHQPAKSELATWLSPPPAPAARHQRPPPTAPVVLAASPGSPAAPASDSEPREHQARERILIVGDSMLDGLLPRLADYAAANGHALDAVIWYGSRTIDWARSPRLADALRDYQPSYVILVIGSSELTTRDIEKRAPAVQRILATVGQRKSIWVGPPNWRPDTGLGALLEREVGSGRYFRSLDLRFERKRDGIHPTLASSQKWMDAIASFITTSSAAPICLRPPEKSGAARPRARVFAPPSP